jgi:hypothetical protein
MNTSAILFCGLSLSAAAAPLAGCGSHSPIGAMETLPKVPHSASMRLSSSVVAYKTSSPLLYATCYCFSIVPLKIYKANIDNPRPIATISKKIYNSSGACLDQDGTLYVTNTGSSESWVSEYALGKTKPLRVITQGISTPAYCAIDASGNLWVTNIGLDNVTEYLKGSTKPHRTITQGLTYPIGIAIDHRGNLYVANNRAGYAQSAIEVYAPGSKSPSRTITDGITWPDGLAVDVHDTLYVANFTQGRSFEPGNVQEYQLGRSKPHRTLTDKVINPTDVVVNKHGWVYVTSWAHTSQQQSTVLEFPPNSQKVARQITEGLSDPQGLAYYPPVLP